MEGEREVKLISQEDDTVNVQRYSRGENRDDMRKMKLWKYFSWWIHSFKAGHITSVTMAKWIGTNKHVYEIAPNVTLEDVDGNYRLLQGILDQFGASHRRQTCIDFRGQFMAPLKYAQEEGFIDRFPQSRLVLHSVEDSWTFEKKSKVKNQAKSLSEAEFRMFKTRLQIELTDLLKQKPIISATHSGLKIVHPENHAISKQTRLMVLYTLFNTGCRFAEVLGITLTDLGTNEIAINKTWDYKSPENRFAPTKNLSSIRKVSVRPEFIAFLKNYLSWKVKYFDSDGDLPILVEPKTMIYNDTFNHFFRSYQKKYGIDKSLSIHKIRHSYISFMLAQKEISTEWIARQVGHSNTLMIRKVYGHLLDERAARDEISAMSAMM